jgi:hypothetical protein
MNDFTVFFAFQKLASKQKVALMDKSMQNYPTFNNAVRFWRNRPDVSTICGTG